MFVLEKKKPTVFEFEYDGKTYSVPARTSLPMSKFRAIRKAIVESDNPEETGFDEIMALFDEYIPEVMESISTEQAMELFSAYANGGDEPLLGE